MTSAPRSHHTVSNHITAACYTARGRTRLCKLKKWHHERRKNLWGAENIAQNPVKPMLNTSGDVISVHALNQHKHHPQPVNPHKPS